MQWRDNINYSVLRKMSWKCQFCNYEARLEATLFKHLTAFHLTMNNVQCPECDYKGLNDQIVSAHVQNVHIKRRQEKPKQVISVQQHNTKEPQRILRDIKNIKGSKEKTVSGYDQIANTKPMYPNPKYQEPTPLKGVQSKPKGVECPECEYVGINEQILNAHIRNMHSKTIKDHGCDKCSFVTGHHKILEMHKRDIHSNGKMAGRFLCGVCSFVTASKGEFVNHTKSCHEEKERFNESRKSSKEHMVEMRGSGSGKRPFTSDRKPVVIALQNEAAHEDVKKFRCGQCDYAAKLHSNLKIHLRTAHTIPSKVEVLQRTSFGKSKPSRAKQSQGEQAKERVLERTKGKSITATEIRRQQISDHLDAGLTPSKVGAIMDCSPRMVFKIVKMKRAGESLSPKFCGNSGRPRSARTEDFVAKATAIHAANPDHGATNDHSREMSDGSAQRNESENVNFRSSRSKMKEEFSDAGDLMSVVGDSDDNEGGEIMAIGAQSREQDSQLLQANNEERKEPRCRVCGLLTTDFHTLSEHYFLEHIEKRPKYTAARKFPIKEELM